MDVIGECVSLFFNHIYPLIPLVYRPSFTASLFERSLHMISTEFFTLATAVCAHTSIVIPANLHPVGSRICGILYRASRDGLERYVDGDIESPTPTSIVIRYFMSGYLHASGKCNSSWHVLGAAICMAQCLNLHHISTYEGLDQVEVELRKRIFWTLYTGDKSASILNSRPATLSGEFFFPRRDHRPARAGEK